MNKHQFWFLSCAWGIIMTLIGAIVTLILMIFGFKPKKNIYGWYTVIGGDWGGLDLGPFCLVGEDPTDHLLCHEFGHAIQNCALGPFMIFISIASAIRYWYREFQVQVLGKSYSDLPDYDSIWFEGSATRLGNYFKKHHA